MTNHFTKFGGKPTVYSVKERDLVDLVHEANLLSHFGNDTWRQIKVDAVYYFVGHLLVRICHNKSFSQPLTVSFASTIMLDFDMQVLTAFGSKELAATLVRADVGAVDFLGGPTQVLLPLGLW